MGRTSRLRKRKRRNQGLTYQSTDFLSPLLKELAFFGWCNVKSLTVRNFKLTGRGVCSKTTDFQTNDVLIQLPLKCLITIATLEEDAAFKKLFAVQKINDEHRVSFQSLLAFYLLHQKHLNDASHIYAYINSIPTRFSTPYFCSITEMKCLPESVLEKTVEQNRKIRESYSCFKQVFTDTRCSYCAEPYFDNIFTLEAFKWAFFAVNSRSVHVNSRHFKADKMFFKALLKDEPDMALAPLLDLFNHAGNVYTKAELRPIGHKKQFEYVVTLEKVPAAISPYTQLFLSYGALCNFKLLIEYGFVIPDNPHDYFQFSLLDIEDFLKNETSYKSMSYHRNKFKFIRDHNLHDQMFVHLDEGISHNLHVVLHLLLKEQSHFSNVLNQVAFGSINNLANIQNDVQILIARKINIFEKFLVDLEKIHPLSESGNVARSYLKQCVCYLQMYLDKYS